MSLDTSCWKPFYLWKLYEIQMGNGFDKNKMSSDNPQVNFVSRVSYNNGVDDRVGYIEDVPPYAAGLVTVALGGSYLGSCFVQEEPFYTAQNVAVMKARFSEMNKIVNLFVSGLVRFESKIKYYAFGRELNTHINKDFIISLPIALDKNKSPIVDDTHKYSDEGFVPDWQFMEKYIRSLNHKPLTTKNKAGQVQKLNVENWGEFRLDEIFLLKGGFYNKKPEHSVAGNIPFLASTESNNGVTEYYSIDDIRQWDKVGCDDNTLNNKIYDGNCIAVTVNGSVCNAYYQDKSFTCSHDITTLYIKNHIMNPYLAQFLCTIIMQDKYRWSYGRKPHDVKKFGKSIIKLPINSNGSPDWQFMEDYIKALPYGDRLEG